MVWFYCDDCGDSIKKPKLQNHFSKCRANSFTCIDCSRVFDRKSVHAHTQCVTEKDKYVKGATKPGGFAETGFFKEKAGNGEEEVVGEEFLTKGPDFKCTICNIWCNTWDQLVNHTTGSKHVKKTRSARARKAEAGETGKNEKSEQNQPNVNSSDKADSSEKIEGGVEENQENKKLKAKMGESKSKNSVAKKDKKQTEEVIQNGNAENIAEQKSKKRKKQKEQNPDDHVENEQELIQNGVQKKKQKIKEVASLDSFLVDKIHAALEGGNNKQDMNKLSKKLLKELKQDLSSILVERLQQDDRFKVDGDFIELKT